MIADELIKPDQWVMCTSDLFPQVPAGSAGVIQEVKETLFNVMWAFGPDRQALRHPLLLPWGRSPASLQILDPLEAQMIPFHVTLKKIEMRGLPPFSNRDEALLWLQMGHAETHPELRGERIDILWEPMWPKDN